MCSLALVSVEIPLTACVHVVPLGSLRDNSMQCQPNPSMLRSRAEIKSCFDIVLNTPLRQTPIIYPTQRCHARPCITLEYPPQQGLDEAFLLGLLPRERVLSRVLRKRIEILELLKRRTTTTMINQIHQIDHDFP